MHIKALAGLLVCCTLLSGGESQVVITDAAPTEFPHIVKIKFNDQSVQKTSPGVFVSGRYVFAMFRSDSALTKDSFEITDQVGTVLPTVKHQANLGGNFHCLKFCEKFKGTPFNMSESSFDALATNVSAQMLFFPTASNTLKKVSVTLLENSTCNSIVSVYGNDAAELICMTSDVTTNFCADTFTDSDLSPTYVTYSVVAIGGQVNGYIATGKCNGSDLLSNEPYMFYSRISHFRQDIIALVPKVDIV